MPPTTPFKRLILRAVLRNVSPMVIPLVSVSDRTDLHGFMMFSMPSWAGAAISATSFAFTAKSSTASAAARRFDIFSCTDRRSSCTFATSWTYGNGTCEACERTPLFPANISRLSLLSASRLNAPTLFIPALGRIVFP
jgi:hypothetical protein